MSLSQLNNLLKDELEYRLAFLTTKNGKSMRRLSTCKVVNLQFSFFSTPIWLERIFICSITPIMHLIARLSSFLQKILTNLKLFLYHYQHITFREGSTSTSTWIPLRLLSHSMHSLPFSYVLTRPSSRRRSFLISYSSI